MDTLSADPSIGAIGLDPKGRDSLVRFRGQSDCTFGIRRSEGPSRNIFSSKMRAFFKDNESSISDNHNKWLATVGELDNNTWKESVLENLNKLSQTEDYTEHDNNRQYN